jgi:hypothetical protein
MVWNPPDPSDYVDQWLAEEDPGIQYLYIPGSDPYEIRVLHPDGTQTIEELWGLEAYNSRIEDLMQSGAKYEVITGPDEIPF